MRRTFFLLLSLVGLLISCSSNEEEIVEVSVSDFKITIDENPKTGNSIGFIQGNTNRGSINYSIISQNPNESFGINSTTGELTVLTETLFDFEINPVITGKIKAVNENISKTINVVIELKDINEVTVSASDFEISMDENPENGQLIGVVDGTTNQGEVTFSIIEQKPDGAFEIDRTTGELRVLEKNHFDFETNPQITGMIEVANGDIFENIVVDIKLDDLVEYIPLEIVAGTGTAGYSGNGSSAIGAELNYPRHMVIDASGNLIFADQKSHTIRKIDVNGIISTIAGTGVSGFSGDGMLATSAQLNNPRGLSLDGSGNILIADSGNNRIRKIDDSGIIRTIAGTGSSGFSGEGGQAIYAELNSPRGVHVDDQGNIYIADTDNHKVRMIDTNGVITTIAGNGSNDNRGNGNLATEASLMAPYDIEIKNGIIYIADITGGDIRKIDPSGIISTILNEDGVHLIGSPTALKFDRNNNLFVTDLSNGVFIIDSSGHTRLLLDNENEYPGGLAFDANYNLFYTSTFNNQIKKIDHIYLPN